MDTNKNTEELARAARGRTVAIVGPAESIKGTGQGELIDSHDVVIRFSHNAHTKYAPEDAGSRTDWLIVNEGIERRIEQGRLTTSANVAMLIRDIVRSWRYFKPYDQDGRLYRVIPLLGSPTIKFIYDAGASEIYLCGMDFFRTADGLCDKPKRAEAVNFRPHGSIKMLCHLAERDEAWTRDFLKDKPNIKCDKMLQNIISS